jgi:2-keto-3-deoxy-L-rhamnonate aldolase RhmA
MSKILQKGRKAMPIIPNHALRRLRDGGLALGLGVHHLRTVATAQLAKAGGFDWLFIDTEHGAFSVDQASQICLAALATGITPIVRICHDALDEGTRALDNGAQGIVVPHVNNADQARRVAEAFHYPPQGHRSWGGPAALYAYEPPDAGTAQAEINREILIVAMIETPEAVANAESIAAVAGIDVLMFGTSDLTAEMGIPGQIGHERVQQAYAKVGEACRKHGKFLGMGGVYDNEWARVYLRQGVRFALASSDHSLIVSAGKQRTQFLRGVL